MIAVEVCSIKINLALYVLGRREDGFHDLYSLFWRLRSPEALEISRAERDSLDVSGIKIYGPNLVERARDALRREYGPAAFPKLAVKLTKHLPAGAGLGAGSGNAAALLRWYWRSYADGKANLELASSLGADVTFLASGSDLAIAEGVGEKLTFINERLDLAALIIFPKWSSRTAEAYKKLDLLRARGARPSSHSEARSGSARILAELAARRPVGLLSNDFIPCLEEHDVCYNTAYRKFESMGALAWGLCGSGSACFALFDRGNSVCDMSNLGFSFVNDNSFSWIHKTLLLE